MPLLPVESALPELTAALRDRGAAVLVAPPGAGKTTRVPLALLEEGWLEGRIVVLEPRRLAARAAAHRMASLLGERVGETVGLRVRMESRAGPRTRVEVVTEGVLTRMLQDDPSLEGVGLLAFDEFHERSLHADLGLALSLQSRALLRSDLRLLVMSATLEAEPVAALLGGAPVVRSEGRSFPVETEHRPPRRDEWMEAAAARAVRDALDEGDGDLLVFLPGAGEIRRTESRLADGGVPPDVEVHALFGALPGEAQDRAVSPAPPGRRKVVLATSIAETSLTIEGVRTVVDAGWMRVPRFDPRTGMTRLETVRVTRDSADQRRGRAGRTGPGRCLRLWPEHEPLLPRRAPEIREADLAPLALELAAWGAEPGELAWLDPPPEGAFAQARALLRELGAVDAAGAITPRGRRMARTGAHPRVAWMLLAAREEGERRAATACDLAALLEERDPLRGDDGPPDPDARLRLEALNLARTRRVPGRLRGQGVDRGALHRWLAAARHRRRRLRLPPDLPADPEAAGPLLALAYPDRVGRARGGGEGRFLLVSGRGAALPSRGALSAAEWIVAAELDGRGAEARVRLAAPLDAAEVEARFGDRVEAEETVAWDAEAGAVRARRRTRLGAVTLREAPLADPDPEAVAAALLDAVRAEGIDRLPWTKEARRTRQRLAFLHRLDPGAWPDVSDAALTEGLEGWLGPWLAGKRSPDALSGGELEEALLAGLPWEARARLDELAPTHWTVPSGSRVPIDYSEPEAPVLAVRLQEMFGATETPRIAGGRVPLLLHLLSPAHRPVQVTSDLAGFWERSYFDVRRDLRGRYPRHSWPEDPLAAEPTRRAKPRR